MSDTRPIRRTIAYATAAIVILCALGQLFNWETIGVGAMIRSAFSLIGIAGAILLLCHRRVAWVLLMPWAILQTWVVITDPSGPWFHQSLHAGWQSLRTVQSGPILMRYEGEGMNFVGLIWLALFVGMLTFRVFPPLQPMPRAFRITRGRGIVVGALAIVLIGWQGYRLMERHNALVVIGANYPGTAVYYRDQLLGRTPLAITPKRLEAWNLPLSRDRPLNVFHTDWTQRLIVYTRDRQSEVILDLKAPFYAPSSTPLPTPWGTRHTSLGIVNRDDHRHDLVLIDRGVQTYPQLSIELLQPPPYRPGQVVRMRYELVNPVDAFEGIEPAARVMFWDFDRRWVTAPRPVANRSRNQFELPADWTNWRAGQNREHTLEVTLPDQPGTYTLMAVFNLFKGSGGSRLAIGSPYSNYMLIEVVDPPKAAEGHVSQ